MIRDNTEVNASCSAISCYTTSSCTMAGVAIGSAAMGGAASVAAAAYQASVGFTARHETTHAQQIDITKRLIAEFEDAYNKGEVYEEDWAQYLLLRDQ